MTVLDFSKALLGDTSTMVFYAKRLLGGGETPFTKADFVDAIQARADATLPDKLTPQQRFSRAISGGDEVAMTLFRAMNAAPGSSVRAPVEKADDGPVHIGPAHAKMHSLAIDRQRERSIPYSAAYTEVYTNAINAALRAAVQREHLQHALDGIHGSGGVTGSMSIQEAQRKEPAKDFSATGTGDYSRQVARKNADEKLQKLADARHAAHPEEKASTSYTKVLLDPANVEIRKAALVAY